LEPSPPRRAWRARTGERADPCGGSLADADTRCAVHRVLRSFAASASVRLHARRLPAEDPDRARLRRRDRVAARAPPLLSRRLRNRVLLKREDQQPVFSFSCAAPTTRWRGALPPPTGAGGGGRHRRGPRGNHAQGVALAASGSAARRPS
jgi:hypothetical protein